MIPDAPPRLARYVGERVQVRTGWAERPAVGTVIDADALGITIDTGNAERLIPWTAITSVRMGRA